MSHLNLRYPPDWAESHINAEQEYIAELNRRSAQETESRLKRIFWALLIFLAALAVYAGILDEASK